MRAYVAWGTLAARAVLLLVLGICVAAILRAVIEHTKSGVHFSWWAIPTVLVMVFIYFRSRRWTGGRDLRLKIKADLEQGTLAVHRIHVADVIEVQEREDEGPSYFVKTADGQVFVFSGQYLDGYRTKGFPWKAFEIAEAPASRIFFGLTRLDASVAPSFTREPFDSDEARQFRCRNYGCIDIDFESLRTEKAQPNRHTDPSHDVAVSNRTPHAPGR